MKNTLALRNTIITGIFLSLLIPFISYGNLYFPFITSKAYLFRVLIEILTGLWVVLAVFDRESRPKKSCVLWSILAFMVVIFISNIKGLNPSYSFWSNFERMEGYVTLLHVFLYFVVVSSVFNTKKIWDRFLNFIVGTTFLHAFYAFLQAGGKVRQSMSLDRIDGTFGNSIYLAGFMLLSLFIAIYLWMKKGNKGSAKYFYASAIVLQIITIFLSGTRGAILGLIGGVFVSLVSYAILEPKTKSLRYSLGGFLVVVAIFLAVIFGAKDSSLVQNITILKRMSEISLQSGTVQARLINWGIAWDAVKERPLLGYGQGNYSEIFDKNYDVRLWSQEKWFDRSHSLFFDWLIAGGFLSLIAYLSIFIACLYYVWKSGDAFSSAEKSSLTGFFTAYFVHTAFVFDNITSYMLLFIIFALIHSRLNKQFASIQNKNISKNLAVVISVIALILIPVSVWAFNSDSYIQNREMIEGIKSASKKDFQGSLDHFKKSLSKDSFGQQEVIIQLITYAVGINGLTDVSAEVKKQFYDTTLEATLKYLESNNNDIRTKYVATQYFAQMGNFDLALKLIDEAIAGAPNKQFIYLPKIEILVATNKLEETKNLLKEVYEINTDNFEFWTYYLKTVSRIGENDLYKKLIDEAFESGEGYKVIALAENSIARSPDNINVYFTLAVAHYRNGNSEVAIQVLKDTEVQFPEAKLQIEDVISKINAGQKVF